MKCQLKNCDSNSITQDGFCEKHGYYSLSDEKYIVNHIKNYLKMVEEAKNRKDKIDICLNLWFYLTYKKEFILKYPKYYTAVIKKGDEIMKLMNGPCYQNKLKRFNNLHLKIKEFT